MPERACASATPRPPAPPRRRARAGARPFLASPRARGPARPPPALETERQVTDWGRSERVEGLFDRTVYEFFYNYWFRCEVEGIEHVPAEGGALIVSNHSGALPPDAPMIAQALKREHSRPRPLHITVEHFFKGYPGFSMLVPKLGCVPAHPANVHRLLADEEQLVLVFPEGRKGTVKTYKDRYRLRRFGRGGFVEAAMRARAPIQPVALIGAEEAAPDLRPLQRAREAERAHLLPAHADVPPLRRAGDVRLPPRQVQDPLPAADPDRRPGRGALGGRRPRADDGPGRARRSSRTTWSTWSASAAASGSDDPVAADPGHRAVHLLGRAARRDARERSRGRGDHRASTSRDPTRELERTEFVRVGTQHALIRRIVQAARIDTVIDARLTVDSINASSRDAHENNVIGTMNILAACGEGDTPVRKLVFKSSAHWYGCEQDDPAFFTEEMARPHPPRTRIERDIVEAEAAVREFAARNRDTIVTVLRFCNGLGSGLRTSHSRLFSLPAVPTILGFDPSYQFIHEDDIVGCLDSPCARTSRGSTTAQATACWRSRRSSTCSARPCCPSCLRGDRRGGRPAAPRRAAHPAEMLNQMRFGRGLDNRKLKAAGYRYRYTTRETVIKLREHQRLAPILRDEQGAYRYEREVEEFLRWSPSVQGGDAVAEPRPRRQPPFQPRSPPPSARNPPPPPRRRPRPSGPRPPPSTTSSRRTR